MTTELEDRLRTHYEALADELHLPPLTLDELLDPSRAIPVRAASAARRQHRIGWSLGAAAAAAALVAGVVIASDRPGAQQPSEMVDPSDTAALTPTETLPDMSDVSDDVPPTVMATTPTDWYRLQPDLDVAWHSDGEGTSMLCLRTPLGSEYQPDDFSPPSSMVARSACGPRASSSSSSPSTPGDDFTLTLSDGSTATRPVERDPQINWGTSRFQLTGNLAPSGLSKLFETSTDFAEPPTTS